MFTLESFYSRYETETTQLAVNERSYKILLPKYLSAFINPHDALHEFPLWAKIWPSSWVLASYLAEMPPRPDKKFLEVGAGVGMVSIVATCCGHGMTMTEYNSDALRFARANAMLNGCPQLPMVKLDWSRPGLKGRFDYIVGSEVTYKNEDVVSLLKLFTTFMNPTGEVLLAGEMRRSSRDFFRQLETVFQVRVHKKVLRSPEKEIRIFLFRLTLKQ
jgi:predicted nicotinamide N-methyase